MLLRNFFEWVGRLRSHRFSPRQLALLLSLFIGFFVVAIVRFPAGEVEEFRILHGVAAVALVPSTLLANAFSYQMQSRLIGIAIGRRDALRITLMGSAANLLPLPGAVVVRTADLMGRGASAGQATGATACGALAWLGLSLVAAVRPLLDLGAFAGWPIAAAGVGALGASAIMGWRLARSVVIWLGVLAGSAGLVGTLAIRYMLLVWALGFEPGSDSLALVAVGALSSAAGFFPSGIGLREVLAGVTATLVELPASLGYLVAGIDDIAWIVTVALGVLLLEGRGAFASLRTGPSGWEDVPDPGDPRL